MERMGRRELLMGAGAGAVGLAAIAVPATSAAADESKSDQGLTGAWLVTHKDTTPDTDSAQAVVTFATGGALASRDLNPPGDAQLGSWKKTGGHGFVATFYDSFTQGPPDPVHILKVVVTGTRNDDKISGTFTFTISPPPPGFPTTGGTGTFEGTRIIAGA
jgi:hypothetical protein